MNKDLIFTLEYLGIVLIGTLSLFSLWGLVLLIKRVI